MRHNARYPVLFITLLFLSIAACQSEAPEQQSQNGTSEEQDNIQVYFVQPTHQEVVSSPVHVIMAAEGVQVKPAGEVEEGTGHFHILVDTDFIAPGEIIPADEQHIHFGTGATEATLELSPGTHVLRLQFANGIHQVYEGDMYREEITITVQE